MFRSILPFKIPLFAGAFSLNLDLAIKPFCEKAPDANSVASHPRPSPDRGDRDLAIPCVFPRGSLT